MNFDMNQELKAYITLDESALPDDFLEMLGIKPPKQKQQDDVQEKPADDLPFSDPNEHIPNGWAMNESFRLP